MSEYNPLAARLFAAALAKGDLANAYEFGLDVTDSLEMVNSSIPPEKKYNDKELAELIQSYITQIEQGRVDLNWSVNIPRLIGAVMAWLEDNALEQEETDGKVDS